MLDTETCFPSFGIPVINFSYVGRSKKQALSTFYLALPLVHFLTPPFFDEAAFAMASLVFFCPATGCFPILWYTIINIIYKQINIISPL